MTNDAYTTQLQAGLGLIEETRKLLDIWSPDISEADLKYKSLESGIFPNVTFRRLRNIVDEGFKPRYLVNNGVPAIYLKELMNSLSSRDFNQLLFFFTCRAHSVLADFIRIIYWPGYMAGKDTVTNEEAKDFLIRANEDGKTYKPWSESTITRVASYLTSCCSDFGLLESGEKSVRRILPFQIEAIPLVYLAYDLHFSGLGDNSVINHLDWSLFGLEREDVLDELKRQALKGWFIVQSAGTASRIGWQYETMEAVVDALAQE